MGLRADRAPIEATSEPDAGVDGAGLPERWLHTNRDCPTLAILKISLVKTPASTAGHQTRLSKR